jgi:hypothetical protein
MARAIRKPRQYQYDKRNFYDLPGWKRWRIVRFEAIERAGGVCEICHKNSATQVHHWTYDSEGWERPSDLSAVCDDCHLMIHYGESEHTGGGQLPLQLKH